ALPPPTEHAMMTPMLVRALLCTAALPFLPGAVRAELLDDPGLSTGLVIREAWVSTDDKGHKGTVLVELMRADQPGAPGYRVSASLPGYPWSRSPLRYLFEDPARGDDASELSATFRIENGKLRSVETVVRQRVPALLDRLTGRGPRIETVDFLHQKFY